MTEPTTVTIELEDIDAHDALRLVALLQTITSELWRIHGPEMSDLLIDDATRPNLRDDDDLPF
ncbi:MAG: hypothetical protein RMA76_35610 [Deltaproteobacteria bacterium]|jgi:hypothetical protein